MLQAVVYSLDCGIQPINHNVKSEKKGDGYFLILTVLYFFFFYIFIFIVMKRYVIQLGY